jgi:DNA helicase-2/ATP-dependent DNA helicase PcrA
MFGSESHCRPSRFLNEIPSDLIREVRPRMQIQRPWAAPRAPEYPKAGSVIKQDWPFRLGETVSHKKFGAGTVISFEGSGEHARVQVNFHHAGAKWLVLAYANLSNS